MKTFILCTFLMLSGYIIQAQTDLSHTNKPLRTLLLNTLRVPIEKELKQPVRFVVDVLKVEGEYAFFRGNTKDAFGKDIDFSKTTYRELLEQGFFDGDATAALLKKVNGKWSVMTYVIGPTDVAWANWSDEYHAPAVLFGID
ncbi:MAG: hypothetical protein JNJ58_09055 [Chitinophagaceae bacterium]|nr:hypothetical protein [Chitinophagaceae bacterium]